MENCVGCKKSKKGSTSQANESGDESPEVGNNDTDFEVSSFAVQCAILS